MRPEEEARRARFLEGGGALPPEGGQERALLEAILASGDLLPDLLVAEGRGADALAALATNPWLRQPKPPALFAQAVDEGTAGAADFADFKRRLRLVRRGASG